MVSVCDGVVISGNYYTNSGSPTGGSAKPGRGVSVRCFMDSLTNGSPDTDENGKPNLSNIVVTYNHLIWQPDNKYDFSQPPHLIDCAKISNYVSCTGTYSLPQVGNVVRSGTPLGQTGGSLVAPELGGDGFDHLHLSVLFARGFARANPTTYENAFYLNPMLMYTTVMSSKHYFQPFFPKGINFNSEAGKLGIAEGDLTRWSGGGFNFAHPGTAYASDPSNSFWKVQTPVPTPPPSRVEWSIDYYPLNPSNEPARVTDLIEYVTQFSPFEDEATNCVISLDTSRTPIREIADCYNLPDLQDDSPYVVTPHPN